MTDAKRARPFDVPLREYTSSLANPQGVCVLSSDAEGKIPPRDHGMSMTLAATDPEAYMEAFMNGFDFVLLAIRGRLAEADMHPAERARLELFLQDYSKIAQAYRDRKAAPALAGLGIQGAMKTRLEPMATN